MSIKKLQSINILLALLLTFLSLFFIIPNNKEKYQPEIYISTTEAFTVQLASGKNRISESNGIINSRLVPNGSYQSNIEIQQDQGYFIKLSQAGNLIKNAPLEVSLNNESWGDFLLPDGSQVRTDDNGIALVDIAEWGKIGLGEYQAKFRKQGTTNDSNSVTISTKKVDSAKYFNVQKPGNYSVFQGCLGENQQNFNGNCSSNNIYWQKINIEEQQNINVSFEGKDINIVSYPYRATHSQNAPQGLENDWTWFLSAGFDRFSDGEQRKWALKTVFYPQPEDPQMDRTRNHTAFFIPRNLSYPGYFVMNSKHDIVPDIDTQPMDSLKVENPICVGGNLGNSPCEVVSIHRSVGWKTAYRMVKVNFPKFKGRAFRIRFWEYDTQHNNPDGSLINATSYNFDEWLFATDVGWIGRNIKGSRGTACKDDISGDCMDKTIIMSDPGFSVFMVDHFSVNDLPFQTRVRKNQSSSWQETIAIKPGDSYQINIKDKIGNSYSGFLEKVGQYINLSGVTNVIPRQRFSDNGNNALWVNDSIVNVNTTASILEGDYQIRLRPYIHSDIKDSTNQLSANNLIWSNNINVEVLSDVPTPTGEPSLTPTPTNPVKPTPTPTTDPEPTNTPTPTPPVCDNPSAPTNFSCEPGCDNSQPVLNFSWQDNSDNEEEFAIYAESKRIARPPANSTSYTYTCPDLSEHEYRVRSTNNCGGRSSNRVTCTCQECTTEPTPTTEPGVTNTPISTPTSIPEGPDYNDDNFINNLDISIVLKNLTTFGKDKLMEVFRRYNSEHIPP